MSPEKTESLPPCAAGKIDSNETAAPPAGAGNQVAPIGPVGRGFAENPYCPAR